MAKLMEDVKKGSDSARKGLSLRDRFESLGEDIDVLAKKTGAEASKLAKGIDEDIKSLAGEIKSIDVKEEVKDLSAKIEKLIDATGDSAKKLALEIKEDIANLRKKL